MANVEKRKKLGEVLIEKGVISDDQLKRALDLQKEEGGLIGQILVRLSFVKEEEIVLALTEQYSFPYLPLANCDIERKIVQLVPENVVRQYEIMPVDKIGNMLTLAMVNPLNDHAIEDVEMITDCRVQVFVSTMTDVRNAIEKYYRCA